MKRRKTFTAILLTLVVPSLGLSNQNEIERLKKERAVLEEGIRKTEEAQALAQKYSNEIQLIPNLKEDGTLRGNLKVVAINPQSFWYKLGLRKNDIITKVDTTEIEYPHQIGDIFNVKAKKGFHTYTILREGKIKVLTFDI